MAKKSTAKDQDQDQVDPVAERARRREEATDQGGETPPENDPSAYTNPKVSDA